MGRRTLEVDGCRCRSHLSGPTSDPFAPKEPKSRLGTGSWLTVTNCYPPTSEQNRSRLGPTSCPAPNDGARGFEGLALTVRLVRDIPVRRLLPHPPWQELRLAGRRLLSWCGGRRSGRSSPRISVRQTVPVENSPPHEMVRSLAVIGRKSVRRWRQEYLGIEIGR